MAHIIITSEELSTLNLNSLPDKSTILEQDNNGNCLKSFILENGKLNLIIDLEEQKRPFSSEKEKENFLSNFNKSQLIDYFLTLHDNSPYREYAALSNKMYSLFNNIHYSGSHTIINNKKVGSFHITIRSDDNISNVKKELNFFIKRYNKLIPDAEEITLNILEKSCSQYGCYECIISSDKFIVTKTTYGRTKTIKEFSNMNDMLVYIKNNLPRD